MTPAAQVAHEARQLGFIERQVPGEGFPHRVYLRPATDAQLRASAPLGSWLHVYLEGDGSPRAASRTSELDPTPRRPLMLRLMALDAAPATYLGRPCYHGASRCDPIHWTLGRYGDPVVTSLVAALRQLVGEGRPVALLGWSGGGTLAMLMAERMPEVRAVVTLAGNLAPHAWAAFHGYTPLRTSLTPGPLGDRVRQLHLLAGRDREVPPALVANALGQQPHAVTRRFEDFDHECCWDQAWPAVLDWLASAESSASGVP